MLLWFHKSQTTSWTKKETEETTAEIVKKACSTNFWWWHHTINGRENKYFFVIVLVPSSEIMFCIFPPRFLMKNTKHNWHQLHILVHRRNKTKTIIHFGTNQKTFNFLFLVVECKEFELSWVCEIQRLCGSNMLWSSIVKMGHSPHWPRKVICGGAGLTQRPRTEVWPRNAGQLYG